MNSKLLRYSVTSSRRELYIGTCGQSLRINLVVKAYPAVFVGEEVARIDPGTGGKARSECHLTPTTLALLTLASPPALPMLRVEKVTPRPCPPLQECTYSLN